MIRNDATDEEIAEGKRHFAAEMAALEQEEAEIKVRLADIERRRADLINHSTPEGTKL